jgi:DNA-binding CsgD family transcriptional regulator
MKRRNNFPVSLKSLLVTKSTHLSLRELQVLLLAAHGQTAKASVLALHISESAIALYMTHARQKLGAKTKSEAIAMFMDTGAVFTESIESVVSKTHDDRCKASDQLHEMQRVSTKLRHLVDGMLLADVTDKMQHTDMAVWREVAEGLLRTAAHTFGYEIVKVRVAEAAVNTNGLSHPEVAGYSPKTLV